jgi:hypothetical protein
MLKIWFPPTLYKLLPLIYLVAGLLMLAVFGEEPLGLALRAHASGRTNARGQ